MLIGDIVRRNAQYFGDADALVVPGTITRSWFEVDDRSTRFANALLDLGLAKSDRLAIFSSNRAEYIEIFFATAKSGVIGAATNIRLAPSELASYLQYVEPTAIVVSADQAEAARRFIDQLPSLRFVIGVGPDHGFTLDYDELVEAASSTEPQVTLDDTDIYQLGATSGTTGVPKGTILTHRNAIAAMLNWMAEMPIRDGDTNLQCIPMFFNPGGPAQLHPVMMKGGRSVIHPGFDPGEFIGAVSEYGVTHTTAVPTMIGMVLDHPEAANHDFSTLRAVVTGGSPVPPELIDRAERLFGSAVFRPFFGMAETYSCGLVLRPEHLDTDADTAARRVASAGKPHPLIQARVIADDGTEVPTDGTTSGELQLRGDTVSPGYFRMDDETAASRDDGWFKSGDIAVTHADGFITIVDRKKDVIITGGINVFSSEIENVVYGHPDVAQCAVIGVPHPQWGEAIHAVVVARPGSETTEEALIDYCAERLASYKKPRSLEFVDELPVGGTGKVLKRELRERYAARTTG